MNERRTAANIIEINTIQHCLCGDCNHSWQQIIKEDRKPALACRMTSKPLKSGELTYDGLDIIKIFIDSCNEYDYTYYPIQSDYKNFIGKLKQLRLFVKENDRYICKACFEVIDVIQCDNQIDIYKDNLIETDFIKEFIRFNCLFKITQVQTKNLPEDYLALRTGKSIYDVAFYGSNPNIWII